MTGIVIRDPDMVVLTEIVVGVVEEWQLVVTSRGQGQDLGHGLAVAAEIEVVSILHC